MVFKCSRQPEEGVRGPEAEVADGFKLSDVGARNQICVLLTVEPALQSLQRVFSIPVWSFVVL